MLRTIFAEKRIVGANGIDEGFKAPQALFVEFFVGKGFEHGFWREVRHFAFLEFAIQFKMGSQPHKLSVSPHYHSRLLCNGLVIGLYVIKAKSALV